MALSFLLHSRPLRENSVVLSFFSDGIGRVDAVMRVSKSFISKPSASRSAKQRAQRMPLLFCCYEAQWSGRAELKQLQCCESVAVPLILHAQALYCGFYLNELLYRLLPRQDVDSDFFSLYTQTLLQLQAAEAEPLLRSFELSLLAAMGYGLCFSADIYGAALMPAKEYAYLLEQGLIPLDATASSPATVGLGADFLALDRRDFSAPTTKKLAKQLLRRVLAMYLGGRPLRSREFFAPYKPVIKDMVENN